MTTPNVLEKPEYLDLPKSENGPVGSISREEASWLAAILDGEGCIHFAQRSNKEKRQTSIFIRIEIGNSCPYLIQRVSELWYKLGLSFFYTYQATHLGGVKKRDYMRIMTSTLRGCQKFLRTIRPYLTTKAKQADLALEYLDWRISSFPTHVNCKNPIIDQIHVRAKNLRDRLRKQRAVKFRFQRLPRRSSVPLDLANLETEDMV